MEYLSFGPLLWQTRTAWMHHMTGARNALVLGDGDGRFTAALLRSNPQVQVLAVDRSGAMLAALKKRVRVQGDALRLRVVCADATAYQASGTFDLICTHFFLDCFHPGKFRWVVIKWKRPRDSGLRPGLRVYH